VRDQLTFGQYWDSITKEDLEFSVGTKTNIWEVKEPLLDETERRQTIYGQGPQSEYGGSSGYHDNNRMSGYYGERY
jgi:hypothetical protein